MFTAFSRISRAKLRPNLPEDYVHRIGRTARAAASGDAISLVSSEEAPYVRAIERLIGMSENTIFFRQEHIRPERPFQKNNRFGQIAS